MAARRDEDLPAWSLPTDAVERITLPTDWPPRVTREWAWESARGAGIRVCVLDSGIELDHPLVGAVQRSVAVTKLDDGTTAVADDDAGDLCGHGTACAGIIRQLAPEFERAKTWLGTHGGELHRCGGPQRRVRVSRGRLAVHRGAAVATVAAVASAFAAIALVAAGTERAASETPGLTTRQSVTPAGNGARCSWLRRTTCPSKVSRGASRR